MRDFRRIAVLLALASSVVAPLAWADFDRHCEERPLDAAERAAAERVLSAFRAALPDAPAGWTVLREDEQVSGVACEIPGKTWAPGGDLVPQPISVYVDRAYLRSGAPPRAAPEAAPVPVKPAGPADAPVRRQELEARLADLQRSRKDAVNEYQEARRAGDTAAQGAARRRDQEISRAMRPVQEELSKLRRAEADARAAQSAALTAAALAQNRAAEESWTDASVSITANLAWVQVRGAAEGFDASGADVSFRQSGGVVLLLGPWTFGRGETAAVATIDPSGPRTRVQTIAVQITGNRATAEALRGKISVTGLRPLVRR